MHAWRCDYPNSITTTATWSCGMASGEPRSLNVHQMAFPSRHHEIWAARLPKGRSPVSTLAHRLTVIHGGRIFVCVKNLSLVAQPHTRPTVWQCSTDFYWNPAPEHSSSRAERSVRSIRTCKIQKAKPKSKLDIESMPTWTCWRRLRWLKSQNRGLRSQRRTQPVMTKQAMQGKAKQATHQPTNQPASQPTTQVSKSSTPVSQSTNLIKRNQPNLQVPSQPTSQAS